MTGMLTAWLTVALRDLRDPGQDLDLPFGAASSRLPA